jgi:hypothetical protein
LPPERLQARRLWRAFFCTSRCVACGKGREAMLEATIERAAPWGDVLHGRIHNSQPSQPFRP